METTEYAATFEAEQRQTGTPGSGWMRRDKVQDGGSAGERRTIALLNEEECCSALHVEAEG